MKVIQILTSVAFGDAIGNHTVALKAFLRRMGFVTEIFYSNVLDKRYPANTAQPINKLPKLEPEDIIIYHFATNNPLNRELKKWPCRKIMYYHNVTPPVFFAPFDPDRAVGLASALDDAAELVDYVDACIVSSEFNRRDLIGMGYPPEKIYLMPGYLIPFEDYAKEPDHDTLKKYSDNWTNLLFVGRVSPNKKQEDIIRAFAYYKKHINPKSRLILVGSAFSGEYLSILKSYVQRIGVDDVEFLGHISFPAIIACYRIADVFLCMSEHEGFCVPLVEAMHFNIPIIAYDAAAVPDTLGGSGILLDSKDPAIWAGWIDRLVNDLYLRKHIQQRQMEQLQNLKTENVENSLERFLTNFLGLKCPVHILGKLEQLKARERAASKLRLNFIKIHNNQLYVEGVYHNYSPCNENSLHIKANEKEIVFLQKKRADEIQAIPGLSGHPEGFKCSIPLNQMDANYDIQFFLGNSCVPADIDFTIFCPVSPMVKSSCYIHENWRITCTKKSVMVAHESNHNGNERKLIKELLHIHTSAALEAAAIRVLYRLIRPLKRKKIWIFSDRALKANDNGECFFNYMHELNDPEIKMYFLLNRESGDYSRIRKKVKVVRYLSFRHKLLFLLSDCVISSNCLPTDFNPFQNSEIFFRDLRQKNKFVYLEHGIKKDYLANYVSKYSINAALLVCSAQSEYEAMNQEEYGYDNNEVILTGLCRYDYLYNNPRNRIALMPTFREYLFNGVDFKTGHFILKSGFENSDYYKFYASLITHPRLLEALRTYDFYLDFVMHPAFYPYAHYFPTSERVFLYGEEVVHRDIYASASLLLTDFSSTTFDFAYLHKPQIYCQFDRERYYADNGHRKQGHFDFKENGFGDVVEDVDEIVEKIIQYISSGCQIEKKYKDRIDQFFAYHDKGNCRRVLDAIMAMEEGIES